jgi:cell division septum initiation protein DivIVA
MNRDVMPPDGYEKDGLFQTVMFGYDRTQVDDYVDAICDELHLLAGAVRRLTPVEDDLIGAQAEIHRLHEIVSANTPNGAASVRIQQMLKLAEDEAAALREEAQRVLDQARRDSEAIRRAAEVDNEHVAADRRREYQRVREDVLAGARAEAARIVAEANMHGGGMSLATNVRNGLAKPRTGTGETRNGQTKPGPVKEPKKRSAKPTEG